MISSRDRFFVLEETALTILRNALAVRPCLPIILPMSSLATVSSIIVTCVPLIVRKGYRLRSINKRTGNDLNDLFHW
jgi:hypothetical protein